MTIGWEGSSGESFSKFQHSATLEGVLRKYRLEERGRPAPGVGNLQLLDLGVDSFACCAVHQT